MNDNWLIVILYDGPVRMGVYGDPEGKPFPDQQAAQEASNLFPRTGAAYSVYVTRVLKT